MGFQDFVEELVRSCAAECSCGHPWPVGRQVGEMTGLRIRELNSVAFQESNFVDLVYSGEE
jgi:hypothetical protein